MDGQAPVASALQLSTFTTVQSIPRPEKFSDMPVTVRLTAPGVDLKVRAPVDIVAGMDVSMSSSTNDQMLDLEKAAMALVIEKLGPLDRLAVLPFCYEVLKDENAKKMAELDYMSNKKDIRKWVRNRNFSPGGGTNLIQPVKEAHKILNARADAHPRAAFIILLSDGDDPTVNDRNEKVWSRVSELKDGQPKYPVHTFGFTGHKPGTLGLVAKKTGGTHFAEDIADFGALGKFAAAFEARLRDATSREFSADGVRASLESTHPGVSILRIDSREKESSTKGDARSGYVEIGEIKAGETTEFTVYLNVPVGDADADVMDVLAVEGAYTQGWDKQSMKIGRSVVSVNRPVPTPPPMLEKPQVPTSEDPKKSEVLQDPCKELDKIGKRLDYWCKVKKDLSAMDEKVDTRAGSKCQCYSTAVLREAALETVNRAMHLDIYTAVVQVVKTRRRGDGGGAGGETKATAVEGTTTDK